MTKIAVVGAGLIGRAWSIVFARAGFDVALWDPIPQAITAAQDFIAERLPAVRARIRPVANLADAVRGADHVQENGPERVADKQRIFMELDLIAHADTVLASSTSGIPASTFTEGLTGRSRCLVAHPVNPPYLIPLVELCPSPWTAQGVVARTRELMTRAGQVPATVRHEMEGFALNRLQGALLSEAFRLIADDMISPADLDALVKHGLGLRWSFMGPLETIDLNAPGGLADYCTRYGPLYATMQRQMTPRLWDKVLIDKLHAARRAELPANLQAVRQEWRDRRLMALLAHKQGQPE
jgi:L-gulonate 3-dehydrogenase